ncbi:palmitoyltransferase akr1 [Sorochytrium milnesiophthora]
MSAAADAASPATISAALLSTTTEENVDAGGSTQQEQSAGDRLRDAAIHGDLARLQRLLDSREATATTKDSQGITALHWAAINSQLECARVLLDRGADVNAIGGDLAAPPIAWAARQGLVQMVELLHSRGGNLYLRDAQGFNALHLAAHANAPFLALLLLCLDMPVDTQDDDLQTPLMRAVYQGPASNLLVDILLKHGADVEAVDKNGYPVLHWALMRSNVGAAEALIRRGARLDVADSTGKTGMDIIRENGMDRWYQSKHFAVRHQQAPLLASRAMEEETSTTFSKVHSKSTINRTFTALPFIQFIPSLVVLSKLPWHVGLAVTAFIFALPYTLAFRLLLKRSVARLHRSPYLPSIIGMTFALAAYFYFSMTRELVFQHIWFILWYIAAAVLFYRSVFSDPGFIPTNERDQYASVVTHLALLGKLDDRNFCTTCMVRRPLRSKHCKHCDRCLTRFDHHCPWVWNCVGEHNHRAFTAFTIALSTAVLSFICLAFQYLPLHAAQEPVTDPSPTCYLPSRMFCVYFQHDAALIYYTFFLLVMLMFAGMNVVMQLVNIGRNITTNESINWYRYDYTSRPNENAPVVGTADWRSWRNRTFDNILDGGVVANCTSFWKGEHWATTYDISLDMVSSRMQYRRAAERGWLARLLSGVGRRKDSRQGDSASLLPVILVLSSATAASSMPYQADESFMQRVKRKSMEEPLVPIGLGLTVAALTRGIVAWRQGDSKMSQQMMRARVGAQGFTVLALLAGAFVYNQKRDEARAAQTEARVRSNVV